MSEKYIRKTNPRAVRERFYLRRVFSQEDFSGFYFDECAFTECRFIDCDLRSAEFRFCTFSDVEFKSCRAGEDTFNITCSFYGEVNLPQVEEEEE